MPKKKRSTNKKRAGRAQKRASATSDKADKSIPAVGSPEGSCRPRLYERYKTATYRFKSALACMVPDKIFESDSVQNLVDAVDYVKSNKLKVERLLLAHLRLAIETRQRHAHTYFGGNSDDGHAYFLLVLNYCNHILKPLRCVPEQGGSKSGAEDQDNEVNRFAILDLEEEEESGDEGSFEETNAVPRPEEPVEHRSLSSYLDSVEDADVALQFISDINDTMTWTSAMLKTLKNTMLEIDRGNADTSRATKDLVSLGDTINLAITNAKLLEDSLKAEYPHLNTSYRIFACAFLSPPINMIKECVKRHSPVQRKFKDHYAIEFVADIIEGEFRPGPSARGPEEVARRFGKRWKLPKEWTEKTVWLSHFTAGVVQRETMTEMEKVHYDFDRLAELLGEPVSSCKECKGQWFDGLRCIGGDRSMLNTLKIMDIFASFGHEMLRFGEHADKLLEKSGWDYSKDWDGNTRPADRIVRDMDYVLIARILPVVSETWKYDKVQQPKENDILPLVSVLRPWTAFDKPTSVSAAFGVHVMLMSIFELQGDGHLDKVAKIGKSFYHNFIDQLKQQQPRPLPGSGRCKDEFGRLMVILKNVGLAEVRKPYMKSHESIALWNPAVASMFLTYIILAASLEAGTFTMDYCGQAKFVLHLHNALQVRGLVEENLPLVSTLEYHFGSSSAVWNNWKSTPEQGKFVYRFNLSMGASHQTASARQEALRCLLWDKGESDLENHEEMQSPFVSRKRPLKISPQEISWTYKWVCSHDFPPLELEMLPDYLQEAMESKCGNFQEQAFQHCLLLNATEQEWDLLTLNLLAVGVLLDEFICDLLTSCASDGAVQDLSTLLQLCEDELGKLDYLESEHLAHLGKKFTEFFSSIEPARYKLS